MREPFDSQAVIDAGGAALVGAEPFAALPLLVGQIPFLEPEAAVERASYYVHHGKPR